MHGSCVPSVEAGGLGRTVSPSFRCSIASTMRSTASGPICEPRNLPLDQPLGCLSAVAITRVALRAGNALSVVCRSAGLAVTLLLHAAPSALPAVHRVLVAARHDRVLVAARHAVADAGVGACLAHMSTRVVTSRRVQVACVHTHDGLLSTQSPSATPTHPRHVGGVAHMG